MPAVFQPGRNVKFAAIAAAVARGIIEDILDLPDTAPATFNRAIWLFISSLAALEWPALAAFTVRGEHHVWA
jgi:hypothetical protein